MARNDARVTDNPKLKQKKLSDGNFSLYLEYYLGYNMVYSEKQDKQIVRAIRKKEFLGLTLLAKPRTPIERNKNKQYLELAQNIRAEREQQFKDKKHGYRIRRKSVDFFDCFQNYIDGYTKGDKRNMQLALKRFKTFLSETDEYRHYSKHITPDQLTKDMMLDFTEYLQSKSKGEGAHTIYARFKKFIKYAIEHDIMLKNPCDGIRIKIDTNTLQKDVLSVNEIKQLIAAHYPRESSEIRRAFIFSLFTGIRFCDIKDLTFGNVDFSNKVLRFEQNKTKGHSRASEVAIPLNEKLLILIGEPKEKQEKIFLLPSHTMCLKALRHWVKRAGIDKHITWHCARHSFATNLLYNGFDAATTASLLGHSNLKCVEKYIRAVDSKKRLAIESLLPQIEL